jgi:hypothetical protein
LIISAIIGYLIGSLIICVGGKWLENSKLFIWIQKYWAVELNATKHIFSGLCAGIIYLI